jgi:hypothetical protein
MRLVRSLARLLIPHHENGYHPHVLRRPYLVGLLGLCLLVEGALVANLFARESGMPFIAAVVGSDIVALTNDERVRAGVQQLRSNERLSAAAQAKADDMAAKNYFSHMGPDGKAPWAWIEGAGYDYQQAGENLAVRFIDSKDVVAAWVASPSHQRNLVKSSYTDIGIGVAHGLYEGKPATYVVQYFGKPMGGSVYVTPGQVLGASAVASFTDSLARQIIRFVAAPKDTAAWALGGVAALLILVLAVAFVHHVQIQSHQLLAPGAVVAAVALTLFAFNSRFLVPAPTQSASVVQSQAGVTIGEYGADIER